MQRRRRRTASAVIGDLEELEIIRSTGPRYILKTIQIGKKSVLFMSVDTPITLCATSLQRLGTVGTEGRRGGLVESGGMG
jgi:hypothetical protein